jgi:hypothetical protein
VEAEQTGALLLAFRLAEAFGAVETEEPGDGAAERAGASEAAAPARTSADEAALLRILTPLAKLTTARQAVAGVSEAVEAFGGAGYIEDTGIPALLRDCQVLTIWEGTTNVLALDALHAIAAAGGIGMLRREAGRCASAVTEPSLARLCDRATAAVDGAERWLDAAAARGEDALQAGARRVALQLGRAMELSLLVEHAQWARAVEGDARPAALARRFAAHGVACIFREGEEDGAPTAASPAKDL